MNVLTQSALVLNRNYQAVNIATVARSLILLWKETANVVGSKDEGYMLYNWDDWAAREPKDDELFVQALNMRICVPNVIRLLDYHRLPDAAVTFSRRNIFKRDHFTCQYCSKQPGSEELTMDHVVPRAQGGVSAWENCVLACLQCNKRKADRTPKQAGMKLRKKPIRPVWKPMYAAHNAHFEQWSDFISEAYWSVPLQK